MKKFLALSFAIFCISLAGSSQCIGTYGSACFSGFTDDIIDNFWTTGGEIDIVNMDSDCGGVPPATLGDPWENYTNTGLSLTACSGQTVQLNIQASESLSYEQGFAVWIDWNQDDVFDDVTEKVLSSTDPIFGTAEIFTDAFTVPTGFPPGTIFKMRARSVYATPGSAITPCDSYGFGETEDYTVIIGTCNPEICEGDTASLDLGDVPPIVTSYTWTPDLYLVDATAGPVALAFPPDTMDYTCTVVTPDSTYTVLFTVEVIHAANPFAGLNDTLCHDVSVPYVFNPTIDVPEIGLGFDWEISEFYSPGSPASIFTPDDDVLAPTVAVSLAGVYDFVLSVNDLSGLCPLQTDTVQITFSKQRHELDSIAASCAGYADGSITVTGTGTLPSADYSIDGGTTWQTSNVFTGLTEGVYSVTSRDIIGCEFTSDIELIDPDPVVITTSLDSLICQNGTATLEASATGGTAFSFDWSITPTAGPIQLYSPTADSNVVTVTAYNENGCFSVQDTIIITLKDPITLTITDNDSICPGFATGATVTSIGGDDTYSYSWDVNGDVMPSGASIAVSADINTTFCVTVSDGCETTPETICTQTIMHPVPLPMFTSDVTAACNPATVTFTSNLLVGDTAVWNMDGVTYTDTDTVIHVFEEVGFYDISLEITNIQGCVNQITSVDYFESVDIPYPDFFINPNPTTIFNTEVKLTSSVDGSGNTFQWVIPGATPEVSTDPVVNVVYPEGIASDYPVELTVTNSLGCINTVTHDVNILSDVLIYAPNAFTPDGDEFNETWRIYIDGIDIYDYHCTVFNRWGETVWESFNAEAEWIGTFGNDVAPKGTYIWVVEAKENTNDRILEFRGTVQLIK